MNSDAETAFGLAARSWPGQTPQTASTEHMTKYFLMPLAVHPFAAIIASHSGGSQVLRVGI
jgi:hypothetical protein